MTAEQIFVNGELRFRQTGYEMCDICKKSRAIEHLILQSITKELPTERHFLVCKECKNNFTNGKD